MKKMFALFGILLFTVVGTVYGEEVILDSATEESKVVSTIESSSSSMEEESAVSSISKEKVEDIIQNNDEKEENLLSSDSIVENTQELSNVYATVIAENEIVWKEINQEENGVTSNIIFKTFKAEQKIIIEEKEFFLLVNNLKQAVGYVSAEAVKLTNEPQGIWLQTDKYVTVINKNYPTYSSFSWQNRHKKGDLVNKTYRVKGYYNHFNGSTYYSLFDAKAKWYGYVNEKGVKVGNGKQGAYQAASQYVTITKNNYDLWQNFNWKPKNTTKNVYNQTFQLKGIYYHINGSTYYSLFNNKGDW